MSKIEIRESDKENLEGNLYTCYREAGYLCTNLEHARGYLFAFLRREETDWDRFRKITMEELREIIMELGFEECSGRTKDCILTKDSVCFRRAIH